MLKPLDLTVLAYLATGPDQWTQSAVSRALGISQSQVHRCLRQLEKSQLVSAEQRPLLRPLRDLVVYGVRYVYPAELGAPGRGVLTAHSAPMLRSMVRSDAFLVWPHDGGAAMGTSVTPLHECVPDVALDNPRFYELMALIDVFRLGRVRERRLAEQRLDDLLGVSP